MNSFRPKAPFLLAILLLATGFGVSCRPRAAKESANPVSAPAETAERPVEDTSATGVPVALDPIAAAKLFDAERAFLDVEHLAGVIGPRIGGTASERAAADYIAGRLEAMGYAVRRQSGISIPPVGRVTENVIAAFPERGVGPQKEEETAPRRIVFGAHYDSIHKPGRRGSRGTSSPGANDNGSGVAVMLEVARVLAELSQSGLRLPYTLEFVAFGAEESVDGNLHHHHYGSDYYVARYRQEQEEAGGQSSSVATDPVSPSAPIIGMISMDMIGVGPRFYARTQGVAPSFLVDKTLRSARELGIPMDKMVTPEPWSDHVAFEQVGIPSVWFSRRRDPDYHSAGDQPGNVRREHLKSAGQAALHLLLTLQNEELAAMERVATSRREPGTQRAGTAP